MQMYGVLPLRGWRGRECFWGRWGVPSAPPPVHCWRMGCSLNPFTPSHVWPPSSERNSPCGDVPAYHTLGSLLCPGVSQKTWSTTRPFCPSGTLGNAGGALASCQLLPKSVDRKTVGPRWPVRAAASSVRRSLGSSTRWCTMWPRNCGPDNFQVRRERSLFRMSAPLRVPMSRTTKLVAGLSVGMASSFLSDLVWPLYVGKHRGLMLDKRGAVSYCLTCEWAKFLALFQQRMFRTQLMIVWPLPFAPAGGMSAGFMDNDRVGDRGGKGAGSDVLDDGEGASAVASIEAALPFSEVSSAWPSFRIMALGYRVSKTVKCSTARSGAPMSL